MEKCGEVLMLVVADEMEESEVPGVNAVGIWDDVSSSPYIIIKSTFLVDKK